MVLAGNDLEQLSGAITGRQSSVFASAWAALEDELIATFRNGRVLITGGGGFIAGQTLRLLLPLRPATVVVADSNENSLAELVRDLRVGGLVPRETRLEPRLVDVTGPLMQRLVESEGPFDAALLFAAGKHVRSERDPVSALHMLNVNINGTYRTAEAVMRQNPGCRLFVVSTDKAADPSSLMGGSKRIMEMQVLGSFPSATSARFANVAFSSGSLLESWLTRLQRGQLLSVPAQTSRFFVSPREAGQLCAIASLAPAGRIAVPAEGAIPALDLLEALRRMLRAQGLEAVITDSPTDGSPTQAHQRLTLVTPRDTAGEKAMEVFVGLGERSAKWVGMVDVIQSPVNAEEAHRFAQWLTASINGPNLPGLDEIVARVAATLPTFAHVGSSQRLDDRI